jgi:hypothetical protein
MVYVYGYGVREGGPEQECSAKSVKWGGLVDVKWGS